MKKLLLFVFCAFTNFSYSQLVYNNAFSLGNTGNDQGFAMCADGQGNYYCAGVYEFWIDIDPGGGAQYLTSTGGDDIYVAKYNSSGVLQWAFTIGGTFDDFLYSINLDVNNNVLICGKFQLTVDFDPGPGNNSATSNGNNDVFLAKYNNAGSYLWAKTYGSSDDDQALDFCYDGTTNTITLTGIFEGPSIDLDPNGTTLVTNQSTPGFGNTDIFVANYNAGTPVLNWAFGIGGTQSERVSAIECDNNGNVVLTGYIGSANIDFDPGNGVQALSTAGSADIFVAKYNNSGTYQWAIKAGSNYGDIGFCIAVDNNDNIYTGGYFNSDSVDFDPGAGTHYLATNGVQDLYVLKLNPAGQYIWAFSAGGYNSEVTQDIAVDATGNVFITGNFGDTVDFDPGNGVASVIGNSFSDGYVAQYNSNGNFVDVIPYSGDGYEFGLAVCTLPGSKVGVSGFFSTATIDFDPGAGVHNLTNSGSSTTWSDGFVAIYGYTSAGVNEISEEHSINIYNDYSGNIKIDGKFIEADLVIYDVAGKTVLSQKNISPGYSVTCISMEQGLYLVNVTTKDNTFTQKVMVVH